VGSFSGTAGTYKEKVSGTFPLLKYPQSSTSFTNLFIPYRGFGSGIIRAPEVYPEIELIDDRAGNLFKAIFKWN